MHTLGSRLIRLDVLAVLIIAEVCWQADHCPSALTYFSKGLLSFQAAHNDLSVTRVCARARGDGGFGCVSVSVCQRVSVSGCTRAFRRGRVTQFGRRLPAISLCHTHARTHTLARAIHTCVDRRSKESSAKGASSPNHALHTLLYFNSAGRDSRRKSTFDPGGR